MKRNLLLAIALVLCATLFLGFAPRQAQAAETTLSKLNAYEYALTYLLEDAGIEKATAESSSVMDGRRVEINGAVAKKDTEATAQYNAGFRCRTDKFVEFINEAVYEVKVFKDDDNTLVGSFKVDTTKKPAVEDIKFNLTNLDAYKAQIAENAQGLKVGGKFTIPSSSALVESKYFNAETLVRTVWYATPQKSSYISLDSAKTEIEIKEVGTYSYYVLYADAYNNTMTVSDLVIGANGWYEKDEDGNPTGDVIIPIFTFEVGVSSAPEVVVRLSEKAFIGLEYTVESFTITATNSNYNTNYKLYYAETEVVKGDNETVAEYIARIKQAPRLKDVTSLLDQDTLSFTPEEIGYYYVELHIGDRANNTATYVSKAINATKGYQKVELEKQVWTNNWQSFVFFGIAFACLVAIIVILCVKPSEKKDDLVVKQ